MGAGRRDGIRTAVAAVRYRVQIRSSDDGSGTAGYLIAAAFGFFDIFGGVNHTGAVRAQLENRRRFKDDLGHIAYLNSDLAVMSIAAVRHIRHGEARCALASADWVDPVAAAVSGGDAFSGDKSAYAGCCAARDRIAAVFGIIQSVDRAGEVIADLQIRRTVKDDVRNCTDLNSELIRSRRSPAGSKLHIYCGRAQRRASGDLYAAAVRSADGDEV